MICLYVYHPNKIKNMEIHVEINTLRKILKGADEFSFFKKYKLLKALNRGGNSHSFKAYSNSLQKDVFIKFFLLPRHNDEVLKFKNEIAIHKLISYKGFFFDKDAVIEFIESHLFKNNLGGYLVLEWLEGSSLGETIKIYKNKTIEEKVQLFHRVANALIPLSQFVEHRDLHPENIMVLDEPFEYEQLRDTPYNTKIKIVDFGESYSKRVTMVSDLKINDLKLLDSSSKRRLTTSLYATPPEYLKNYKVEKDGLFDKSWNYDSWALGLIGFKIFFNEDLFEIKNIKDYVSRVYSNQFQPDISQRISEKFMSLEHKQSKVLEHIFHYLLRVDPAQRTGDGNVGSALYFINFKKYELSQNLESSEYLYFIQSPWNYLDSRGLTRFFDMPDYY